MTQFGAEPATFRFLAGIVWYFRKNVRREVSRHFRDKRKAYLRAKIEELEINIKIQNIRDLYRGINDFKKG